MDKSICKAVEVHGRASIASKRRAIWRGPQVASILRLTIVIIELSPGTFNFVVYFRQRLQVVQYFFKMTCCQLHYLLWRPILANSSQFFAHPHLVCLIRCFLVYAFAPTPLKQRPVGFDGVEEARHWRLK